MAFFHSVLVQCVQIARIARLFQTFQGSNVGKIIIQFYQANDDTCIVINACMHNTRYPQTAEVLVG